MYDSSKKKSDWAVQPVVWLRSELWKRAATPRSCFHMVAEPWNLYEALTPSRLQNCRRWHWIGTPKQRMSMPLFKLGLATGWLYQVSPPDLALPHVVQADLRPCSLNINVNSYLFLFVRPKSGCYALLSFALVSWCVVFGLSPSALEAKIVTRGKIIPVPLLRWDDETNVRQFQIPRFLNDKCVQAKLCEEVVNSVSEVVDNSERWLWGMVCWFTLSLPQIYDQKMERKRLIKYPSICGHL